MIVQPRVVILTTHGFQDEEYIYPYYRMLEVEFNVVTATIDSNPAVGKYGTPTRGDHIQTADMDPNNFDAIIIPGGDTAPDRLRTRPEVKLFIRQMDHDRKLLAAICHGPWVLVSAGVLKHHRATCIPYMRDDLINAGAQYDEEAQVVVEDNIITAPHYRNNGDFMREVIKWLTR